MMRPYYGWAFRISTSTTMVFCILVETTCPTFSVRWEFCSTAVFASFALFSGIAFVRLLLRICLAAPGGPGLRFGCCLCLAGSPGLRPALSLGLRRFLGGLLFESLLQCGRLLIQRAGGGRGNAKNALPLHGLDPCNILLEFAQLLQPFVLAHTHLKAYAEDLLRRLPLFVRELSVIQIYDLFDFHDSALNRQPI